MKNFSSIAAVAAASVAASAHADFVDFEGVTSVNDQGNNVVMMYATFDSTQNVMLNVFDASVQADGAFIHSDVQIGAGGTWLPNASLDIAGFSDSSNDSFVTIGYGVGASAALNATALDPNFLDATSGLGSTVPTDAGWYNGNPSTTISGDSILIGQFVFSGDLVFSFSGSLGFKDNAATSDVEFGSGSWSIPSPGALALLGLGGIVARRRRG